MGLGVGCSYSACLQLSSDGEEVVCLTVIDLTSGLFPFRVHFESAAKYFCVIKSRT